MTEQSKDKVIRAMADDGSFRVIVVDTTETCKELCKRQEVSGKLAERLCELLTGTVIVRETMAPWFRAQSIAVGNAKRTRIVADVYPDGSNRGLVQTQNKGEFELGKGALLQVMRGLPNDKTHEGIVDISDCENISEGFMSYMQISEQVNCVIQMSTKTSEARIIQSGGYIVQLLPEASRSAQMIMTERLDDFPSMDAIFNGGNAWLDTLLDELLYGMPYSRLDQSELRFGCQCSENRIFGSLASLDKETLGEVIKEEKVLEIDCEYCGENYRIHPEKVRSLLEHN